MDDYGPAVAAAGTSSTADLSARDIVAELLKREQCSEKAVMSCSRQASYPAFVKEFVAAGGLAVLLESLQVSNQQRAVKPNVSLFVPAGAH